MPGHQARSEPGEQPAYRRCRRGLAGVPGDAADLAADRDRGLGDGLARSDRVPERAGCHRDYDRGAGPGGHCDPGGRDRGGPGGPRAGHACQDGARFDDLDVLQVPADAGQEVLRGGDHASELAGLGGGGVHAEHDADDRDLAAAGRPDRGEGQARARRG